MTELHDPGDLNHLMDYLLDLMAKQQDPQLGRLQQAVSEIRRKYRGPQG